MAKYKNRDYTIARFEPADYMVVLYDKDGYETVRLIDVTMTTDEKRDFFKQEQNRFDSHKRGLEQKDSQLQNNEDLRKTEEAKVKAAHQKDEEAKRVAL